MSEKNKIAIMVAGMHRSGTSVSTRMLNLFGCDLSKLLIPANNSNPKGHWESKNIVYLNEEILAAAGSSWDDWTNFDPRWRDSLLQSRFLERAQIILKEDFGNSHLFVFKDPRICRLLPFWIKAVQDFGAVPFVVLPIRNPLDVAVSLEKRDGIHPWFGHLMWLRNTLDAEQGSRGLRRAWLSYNELLSQPYAVMNTLGNDLGIEWPKRVSADLQIEIDEFLSPKLYHYHTSYAKLAENPKISRWVVSSFEIFNRWCHGDMNSKDIGKLIQIKTAFDSAIPTFSGVIEVKNIWTVAELNARIGTLGDALATRDSEIAELNARIGTLGDALATRDSEIAELNARIGTLGDALATRDSEIAELNARIGTLGDALATRDSEIAELNARIGTLGDALATRDSEIAELNARIGTLGDALATRDSEIAELNARIGTLGDALATRDNEINNIYASTSWRVTLPLRNLRRMQIALTRKVYGTTTKTIRLAWRKIPISPANKEHVRDFIFKWTPLPFLRHSGSFQNWNSERKAIALSKKSVDCVSWGIIATPHTLFVAKAIERQLQVHGWNVSTMTAAPDQFFLDYYIVICPQIFERIPPYEKLISFQMEQTMSSRWFNQRYMSILNNSYAVLEYATHNFSFLKEKKIAFPHVHYLPIGGLFPYENVEPAVSKTYDILFYGDSNSSPRRQRLLSALKEKYNVLIKNDTFGPPMERIIQSARVVINLHYYEDGLLETPRIWQCLSLGTPVVSEISRDHNEYQELENVVTFFEQGSVDLMLKSVEKTLKNPPSMQEISFAIAVSSQRFSFMFDRFLIATGFLESGYVRKMSLPILTDKVVVSMPETFERRRKVLANPIFNEWTIFEGIRRQPGWIGCGLSHYVIAQQTLCLGMKRVQVAEDDVVFEKDFSTKIESVHRFLDQKMDSWDLFSGLISDLHADTEVVSVENFEGIKFVTIDKMTSTVFCIYNQKFCQTLTSWNFDNLDPKNTIDRFIEKLPNIRIVVTLPFLVRQNNQFDSILWGFNNQVYDHMIKESENKLYELVRSSITSDNTST